MAGVGWVGGGGEGSAAGAGDGVYTPGSVRAASSERLTIHFSRRKTRVILPGAGIKGGVGLLGGVKTT